MSLIAAVRDGDLAAAARFIRAGADVNCFAPESLTPLMIASGQGQAQMVELLLFAGAQVNTLEPRAGAAALHKAALSGNPDVVDLLLKHRAFIDQQSPILGHTALMDAIVYKHEEVVRLLLNRGARTTIRNHWQETALDIACRDGLSAIASLIKAKDREINEAIAAQTLVAAIKRDDVSDVDQLISKGARVNARVPVAGNPDDDYTPLAIAARQGNVRIVRSLLKAGANPRRVIGLFLGTALHEACYFGHTEVVRNMTDKELSPSEVSELEAQGAYNGMTPLHDAVWHGHINVVKILVEAGHRLDLRTHAGLTALELALLYGYEEIARFLADAQAVKVDFA